ncbi:MAG: methionine--tRNA ligase, partial [Candidatus Binataceae bacterium]
NADLANDLGNLVSRVLSMAQRYCGGEVMAAITPSSIAEQRLHEHMSNLERDVDDTVGELAFNRALERIWARLDTINKYIVETSPFTLARDKEKMPRVAEILTNLLESLRVVANVLGPFMPVTSARMTDLLNLDDEILAKPFGEGLRLGHKVKPPVPLFPRIEQPAKE